MNNKAENIEIVEIENRIFSIRGEQVMIDRDLAELYQIGTKVLNQSVKRNMNRFPPQWRFQLSDYEVNKLVTKCDRLSMLKHSATNPYAFTEQGVAMLATVLRSEIAGQISILIISAFVEMRKFVISNKTILSRVNILEQKQSETDRKFEKVFTAMESGNATPKQGIFFEGQIFDAWMFATDLIQSAEKSLLFWICFKARMVKNALPRCHPEPRRCYMEPCYCHSEPCVPQDKLRRRVDSRINSIEMSVAKINKRKV
ncbi:MAG: ORF6N domain-containing protein [Bacteroidales bacterium]